MATIQLADFIRPNTVSIFANDPTSAAAGIVAVLIEDVAIPLPNRVRMSLTQSISVSRPMSAARSPVERAVVDNLRPEPVSVSVTGSLAAHHLPRAPFGLTLANKQISQIASRLPLNAATALGAVGSILRPDLRALGQLQRLQERRQPVILVTPIGVFPSMAMSIEESHTGLTKVDLSLRFDEIKIISPIYIAGNVALEALLTGAAETQNVGGQVPQAATAPVGVGGGLG